MKQLWYSKQRCNSCRANTLCTILYPKINAFYMFR